MLSPCALDPCQLCQFCSVSFSYIHRPNFKKFDNTIFYLSGVTGLNNSFHSTSLRVYDLIERSLNYSILPHMWATERNTVKKLLKLV